MNQNPYATPQNPGGQQVQIAPPMTIGKLLFSFQGRINRAKFWGAFGASWLVLVILLVIGGAIAGSTMEVEPEPQPLEFSDGQFNQLEDSGFQEGSVESEPLSTGAILGLAGALVVYLIFLWIALALQAKRWHDRNKSGWMVLINLIPFGGIWALVECGFLEGTIGPNLYGPDPLAR